MKKLLLFTVIIFLCSGQRVFAQEKSPHFHLIQDLLGQTPSAQSQQGDSSPTPTQIPNSTPTPSPSPTSSPGETPTPTQVPQPTPTLTVTPEPPSPMPTDPQPTPGETPPPGIPVVQVKLPTPTPELRADDQQNGAHISNTLDTPTQKPEEDPITRVISPPLGAILSHIPQTLYTSSSLNPIQTVSLIAVSLSIFSFGLILIEEDIMLQAARIGQWYRTMKFRIGKTIYISQI